MKWVSLVIRALALGGVNTP